MQDHETREAQRSPVGAPATGFAVQDIFAADEILERVVATADEEIKRPSRLMFLSGLAAGLSIGLSFYARAAVTSQVPEVPLVGNLFYPIGFLLIVIGRYQLYTENTLTPVTLALARLASLPTLLRVWGIVLAANMVGATILALVMAQTNVLTPEAASVAMDFWHHAEAATWDALFVKGIIAGWLVASMVWLIHAARDTVTRVLLVIFMMTLIPSADLYHCIIGFCEAMYAVFLGEATLATATLGFFLPVLLGNTLGGVLLVAILNFSIAHENQFNERGEMRLSWREWLVGYEKITRDTTLYGDPQSLEIAVHDGDHIRGDGRVTLVQYGDFECENSHMIYEMLKNAAERVDFRYVFRHMPLMEQHPHALRAAVATEAAHEQDAFWAMYDMLFENQDALEDDDLIRYAEKIGLDLDRFREALDSKHLSERVEAGRREARDDGVTRTTNLFINAERYTGEWEVDPLVEAIEAANQQ